jgi:hypothetical protein
MGNKPKAFKRGRSSHVTKFVSSLRRAASKYFDGGDTSCVSDLELITEYFINKMLFSPDSYELPEEAWYFDDMSEYESKKAVIDDYFRYVQVFYTEDEYKSDAISFLKKAASNITSEMPSFDVESVYETIRSYLELADRSVVNGRLSLIHIVEIEATNVGRKGKYRLCFQYETLAMGLWYKKTLFGRGVQHFLTVKY